MMEISRNNHGKNYDVVTLKSENINTQKDFLDFLFKIIEDDKFEMTEILIKDYGDRDTWDQYEKSFFKIDELINSRDELYKLDLNSIKIKGYIDKKKCLFFLINENKLIRYGTDDGIDYIEYFTSLGY